jgi:AcrR family transcriptional regulator
MPDPTRRSDASRRAIVEAALDLVGEIGYAKLSIEGIAARAGVGKQTIYRWWPSKAAVLLEGVIALAEGGEGGTGDLPDTGDLEADLKLVFRATLEQLHQSRYDAAMRALATEIPRDPALAADYAERLDGPLARVKRDRLRTAQEAGQLSADLDLDIAAEMLWGPLRTRWLQRDGPLTPAFTDAVVETALNGLRPR